MDFYPVRDRLSIEEHRRFDIPLEGLTPSCIKVVKTGSYLCPKKGEWYLSGAIPEGYKAYNDLDTPYYICKLVKTQTAIVETIVKEI